MNNQYKYEKVINYGMLSPKLENSRHLKLNKNKSSLGNYISYSKYTNAITGSPINIYLNKEKFNNNFISDNSRPSRIVSPLQESRIKLNRSSSQKNMTARPLSSRNRRLPSVLNNQNNNYNYKSPRSKNSSSIIYNSSINESFINKQNFFNLETEKLYQETFQIRKLAKILSKELSQLKKENIEKDKIIDLKEKQINDIILTNISKFENGFKNSNDINYSDENSIISISNPNLNSNNITNNGLVNDKNSSITCNDSIYANALSSNRNSSTGNLFLKIKKEIKQTNNEIKIEKEKIDKLKKSLFITKMNELNIESNLLESQINKINSLLSISLKIKDKNEVKLAEIGSIQENMSKQEKIIFNLINMTTKLEEEESELKNKFHKNKNELKLKIKEVSLNNSKISQLKKKNIDLSNDKVIKNQSYTININGNLVAMNSVYMDKINKLKGSIKFYKRQIKYSDIEINKLKDRRKKIINSEKIKGLKIESNDVDKNNISDPNKKINLEISPKFNLPENEIISKLRMKLRESKESEKKLEEKVNLYQKKLKEIDIKEGDKEEGNQSQIEFGIDNDNPYYIENEDNIPEKSNKFTSSQFNQFTYVLFKNFESKGIVLEESKNKIINPFVEFAIRNNLTTVEYPSNNFDFISEEFTKIILKVLNCDNLYNHILTKIFISALFYNSDCNINKLIEYFNVLFSYTRNYFIDEQQYINKLKNKYKEQTKKLISCISHYINNEINSSLYFPLLKMKELLDQNDINLKDKYIEFLFYYMKKFNDPDSKLGDLKFSLLNNIMLFEDGNINIINRRENEGNNLNVNLNEEQTNVGNLSEDDNLNKNIEITNNKEDSNIIGENDKNNVKINNKKHSKNGIKTPTEVDYSKRRKKKNNTDKNENSDDYEEDEDSMTEITNEEYIKQLTEAICMMQKGLKEANTNFNDLMTNVIQKRKINGIFYECITIEDFNDQLKSINIVLSDLKLSCLCSKYSIPNELRLIDKNKIEKDIEDQIKGTLKLEEEEVNE